MATPPASAAPPPPPAPAPFPAAPRIHDTVQVRRERLVLPTYEPQPPDRNPMFLERRVYQGSSGRVYPLPFYDRIAENPAPRAWDAIYIENAFLSVLILPEIGGRIHAITDLTNGYDLVYRQDVIKPALVGLAGPWASGGIEFNWPQHHRPATFMPAQVAIERGDDGSVTVWCGDHDPMSRMKGMHGVCLRPGAARVELRVRASNRTSDVQTFLWWANVATRVHEAYQSFFPPDVAFVADHAKRAISEYPLARGTYYGVDYGARGRRGVPAGEVPPAFVPPHARTAASPPPAPGARPPAYAPNDLSWYANIPVPTSYMAVGSKEDFFGGYDHAREAGIVHIADHRISPGKKQWTWGNAEFGYAWDRNLTDPGADGVCAPYIEIMSGVFTDNQPDFSFLQPGETKTWSQFWYPIRRIGPAHQANADAALRLDVGAGRARIGVCVTRALPGATVVLKKNGRMAWRRTLDLSPSGEFIETVRLTGRGQGPVRLAVLDAQGREVVAYEPRPPASAVPPAPATEPPEPAAIASADELCVTGLHLEQYRHATRCPAAYWREALRRDPLDARANLALGRWFYRRGEFALAESRLRAAITRLTLRNPNPADGEPLYFLGLVLRRLGRDEEAADAFAKAGWNHAWHSASQLALAEISAARGRWSEVLEQTRAALRGNTDDLRARCIEVIALRHLDRASEATARLAEARALDPLDAWARLLAGEDFPGDTQTRLDVAHDLARCGQWTDALALLDQATPEPLSGTAPLVAYTAAWLCAQSGDSPGRRRWLRRARHASPDYCFPARLEEIGLLEWAQREDPRDPRAPFYLGNLLFDRRRHPEAIAQWERAVALEPANAVAWRNLGIARLNILRRPAAARAAYERALAAAPDDARLWFERDQLWKRTGVAPRRRLKALERRPGLVAARDDLVIEHAALLNHAGRHAGAAARLAGRRFQPWEGGEGLALGQHVRTQLALGREALARGEATVARAHFEAALSPPKNLGEARHPLANASDIHYELGRAAAARGDRGAAKRHWRTAAASKGDFQGMSVRTHSEMTYYRALALRLLGRESSARGLFAELQAYARRLRATPARIDYFATSLPALLLFDDDLQARNTLEADFLEAQALAGLGRRAAARRFLAAVLARDPAHAAAHDLNRTLSL